MSPYVFIIFDDIALHDGRDTLGCANYEKVCIFLKEVWQARSASNILDWLILLLLLRKKILKVFRACGVEEGNINNKFVCVQNEDLRPKT